MTKLYTHDPDYSLRANRKNIETAKQTPQDIVYSHPKESNRPERITVEQIGGSENFIYLYDNKRPFRLKGNESGFVSIPFIITVKTDNPGESNDDQFTISTEGGGYDYNVDWGDGSTDTNVTGDITHTYSSPGTYTIEISGTFPRIYHSPFSPTDSADSEKLLTVEQWGSISWESMQWSFTGCTNLTISATDSPDLSNVANMNRMFFYATSFDQPLNDWDVSNVTLMQSMFRDATSFNRPLDNWDVSNVTSMANMFDFTALSSENYARTLIGWANTIFDDGGNAIGITLGASGVTYSTDTYSDIDGEFDNAVDARDYLINTLGWTIQDSGEAS